MRLAGRAGAAAEILADIVARRRPATEALKDWGNAHRFAGSADRAAIGNVVFDSLRRKSSQAWRIGSDDSVLLVIATLLDQWRIPADELAAQFRDDAHAPQWPDESVLRRWREADLREAGQHVRADVPEWTAPLFAETFAEGWIGEAAALSDRPPLDLRVNTLKATREKVLARLARLGAKASPHAPFGIRIEAPERDGRLPNVTAEAGYQKGWFEIQDEGSQIAAAIAEPQPGEQVLDWCAGGGGKTLAFAAAMENRGQIHAHDDDRQRLKEIHARLRRAGARNVQVYEPRSPALAPLAGKMDCVLVDAPCTGSGTWRRRPDAKWRLTEQALAKRMAEQEVALDQAARFVRPAGRLVYVTCSMFAEENERRVAAFLARQAGFSAADIEATVSGLCPAAQRHDRGRGMVLLTPKSTATDGFFVAVMKKSS
jgi:16S rRNA (cytosine967-C5)-methyltransferase